MSLTARLTLAVARAQSELAEPVEAGCVAAEVLRHHPDLLRRHVQLVVARVLEEQVVALGARRAHGGRRPRSDRRRGSGGPRSRRAPAPRRRTVVARLANRGALRVCRREPKRSSSVTTASRPGSKRNPAASGASIRSTGKIARRPRRLAGANRGRGRRARSSVPSAAARSRRRASSTGFPSAVPQPRDAEIEPLGELGQAQLDVTPRSPPRAGAAPAGPATRSPRRGPRPPRGSARHRCSVR